MFLKSAIYIYKKTNPNRCSRFFCLLLIYWGITHPAPNGD